MAEKIKKPLDDDQLQDASGGTFALFFVTRRCPECETVFSDIIEITACPKCGHKNCPQVLRTIHAENTLLRHTLRA